MKRLLRGFGIYEDGSYKSSISYKHTKEYSLWANMIERCYNVEHIKRRPNYEWVGVSDNFKYFQYFAEWCNNQTGFGNKGWHLDKDILSGNSKMYSEDTCVFVPQEVNSLLSNNKVRRGTYPLGVNFDKNRNSYRSVLSCNGKSKQLGRFHTQEDAFNAYKSAKESQIKLVAEKYKGLIDDRVYESLLSWEINIED